MQTNYRNAPVMTRPFALYLWSGYDAAVWLARCKSTMLDVEYMRDQGRISESTFRWFHFFWTWGACRLGGAAGRKQNRRWFRLGAEGMLRTHERIARMIAS